MSRGRRWTKEETLDLWNAVGSYSIAWIRRRTQQPFAYPNAPKQRSVKAIHEKVRREFGPGGLTRGSWTLRRLLEYTGYDRVQVMRAQQALRQRWARLGPRGRYLITQEQFEELVAWLVHDYWSAKSRLYGCVWCSTERTRLKGVGLCARCFWKHRRLCVRLGLPTRLSDQTALWVELVDKGTRLGVDHGRFLERAASRTESGIALEPEDLRTAARIRESLYDVGTD